MCKDGNDGCCTLRFKAMFLAIWSIVNGIVFVAWTAYSYSDGRPVWFLGASIFAGGLLISILLLVGGICLFIAIKKSIKWLFILGLVLTWLFPVYFIYFVFPLVIHIIFTICSVRYYQNEM